MADIINMPNSESRGGSGFGMLFGLGLLGAGAYLLYKKVTGQTLQTQDTGSSGGGFFEEIFGGGGGSSSSSSGTPTGTTTPEPVPIQPSPVPEATKNASSSSGSYPYSSSAQPVQTTSTYLGSSYTSVSDSVENFLLAGRTGAEKAGYSKALDIMDQLKQSNYVIDSTRQGGSVYNVISGTTGQVYGGGAGISYSDAVSSGVESKTGLATITVDSSGKVTGLSNVKPIISTTPVTGTTYGSGTSGSTSKSSGSTSGSGGSAVQSLVNIVKSKGTSSASTSGNSGNTVTTSTGFTITSTANKKNSAVAAVQAAREKKKKIGA